MGPPGQDAGAPSFNKTISDLEYKVYKDNVA